MFKKYLRETLFHPHSESHKVVGYLGVICLIRLLDHVCGDRTSEQGTPDLSGMDHVCGNGTSEQDTPDLSGMIRRLFDLAEFASITHAQEAVKYLQRSFSLQPSYFFVCLLCSLLLSLDSNGVNRHAVRQICIDYCRKEPDNPGAIRLYLDFCMIHDNGILDLSDSRRLAAWVPYAERLIKIDPCNDYALTLLLKFYENRNGVHLFDNILPCLEHLKILQLLANRAEYSFGDLESFSDPPLSEFPDIFPSVSRHWLWRKLLHFLGVQRRSAEPNADAPIWRHRALFWKKLFFSRPVCDRELAVIFGAAARYLFDRNSYASLNWAHLNAQTLSLSADLQVPSPGIRHSENSWWGVVRLESEPPSAFSRKFECILDKESLELLTLHEFAVSDFLGYEKSS